MVGVVGKDEEIVSYLWRKSRKHRWCVDLYCERPSGPNLKARVMFVSCRKPPAALQSPSRRSD